MNQQSPQTPDLERKAIVRQLHQQFMNHDMTGVQAAETIKNTTLRLHQQGFRELSCDYMNYLMDCAEYVPALA